jgi:hypothetical protein
MANSDDWTPVPDPRTQQAAPRSGDWTPTTTEATKPLDPVDDVMTGIGRGLAGVATSAYDLSSIIPGMSFVKQAEAPLVKPYVDKLRQYQEPPDPASESWKAWVARNAVELGPALAQPELGLEGIATRYGVPALQRVAPRVASWLPKIARTTENAIQGGVGAMTEPTKEEGLAPHLRNAPGGAVMGVGAGHFIDKAAKLVRPLKDFGENTVEWMQHTLGFIGKRDQAPKKAGVGEIQDVRDMVETHLNAANSQLSVAPSRQLYGDFARSRTFVDNAPLADDVKQTYGMWFDNNVLAPIQNGTASWDYSAFVSRLGQQAEDFYRAGQYPQARALRTAINAIEKYAAGPPEAKAARDAGNKAYQALSILEDAAPPETGGIAKPSALIKHYRTREHRYGQNYATNAAKQRLEQARQWLEAGEPGWLADTLRYSPYLLHYPLYHHFGAMAPAATIPLHVLAHQLAGSKVGPLTPGVRDVAGKVGRAVQPSGAAVAGAAGGPATSRRLRITVHPHERGDNE